MSSQNGNDRAELDTLLAHYKTALLTTRGEDGHFHTRPMSMQRHRTGEELWFVTATDTRKSHDLEHDSHCALAFHDGGNSATYVSVSGTAELVRDRDTLRRLWEPEWKAWFPDGPETKDAVLIRFRP